MILGLLLHHFKCLNWPEWPELYLLLWNGTENRFCRTVYQKHIPVHSAFLPEPEGICQNSTGIYNLVDVVPSAFSADDLVNISVGFLETCKAMTTIMLASEDLHTHGNGVVIDGGY